MASAASRALVVAARLLPGHVVPGQRLDLDGDPWDEPHALRGPTARGAPRLGASAARAGRGTGRPRCRCSYVCLSAATRSSCMARSDLGVVLPPGRPSLAWTVTSTVPSPRRSRGGATCGSVHREVAAPPVVVCQSRGRRRKTAGGLSRPPLLPVEQRRERRAKGPPALARGPTARLGVVWQEGELGAQRRLGIEPTDPTHGDRAELAVPQARVAQVRGQVARGVDRHLLAPVDDDAGGGGEGGEGVDRAPRGRRALLVREALGGWEGLPAPTPVLVVVLRVLEEEGEGRACG